MGAVEPLLPKVERRFRYPGRKRLPDRQALQGILFVLHTGIAWRHLPLGLGLGGGSTCYRRPDEWQRAGVWERLHELLLAEQRAAGEIEWARAVADSSHVGDVELCCRAPLRSDKTMLVSSWLASRSDLSPPCLRADRQDRPCVTDGDPRRRRG